VDLDGTLTAADVSIESFVRFARRGLIPLLLLLLWCLRGRAFAKAMVARSIVVDPATLPYREEVLVLVRQARADGRRVVLASASHARNVTSVAEHLGLFDAAVGSDDRRNLKGRRKLEWIKGDATGQFHYVGDSAADEPIWREAEAGYTVGRRPRDSHVVPLGVDRTPQWKALLRAMRPHQWAKNLLLVAPLAASGQWSNWALGLKVLLAFALFSMAASGVYLLNDLIDIDADRVHPTKRNRPIASGALSIPLALVVAFSLLLTVVLVAPLALGGRFEMVLGLYLLVTTLYTFRLKSVMALDVIVLASLYAIRVFAGGVAIGVPISSWLLLFSIFIFLSLAYLKRYTELLAKQGVSNERIKGRGYRVSDLEPVMMNGISTGMVSVLVLGMYISEEAPLYAHGTPKLLWLLCLIVIYWLNRIWIMARRGQVSGDPIAFAITDIRSIALGVIAVAVVAAAQRIQLAI
jgi:4-hydroxybenzoate polyprenyltransferase